MDQQNNSENVEEDIEFLEDDFVEVVDLGDEDEINDEGKEQSPRGHRFCLLGLTTEYGPLICIPLNKIGACNLKDLIALLSPLFRPFRRRERGGGGSLWNVKLKMGLTCMREGGLIGQWP